MAFLLCQANVNIELEHGGICRWLLMWPLKHLCQLQHCNILPPTICALKQCSRQRHTLFCPLPSLPLLPLLFPSIYVHSFTSLGIKLGVVKEGKSRGRKGVEKWMWERGRKGTEEWQESGPVSTWNESAGLKILCQLRLRYSSQAKPEVLISVTGGGASGRN